MASFYTQLLGQGQFAAGEVTLGGPWPGARVVVRDVEIQDQAGNSTAAVIFGSSDTGVIAGWINAVTNQVLHWVGSQALTDGDTLQFFTDGTSVVVRVSGWVLLPFT